MLLAFIICQLSVLVAANPFHKYPFVFLLDVGNEELEKTNTEQIRLSIPGGSVALRYPAIGDGNTIGHIRVSGIDFGTNLKANIVDGGPGYKYVVIVFMGNSGVPYDAVVTVQTVNDKTFDTPNIGNIVDIQAGVNQVEEDPNNSAEDLSDDAVVNNDPQSETYVQSNNAELMQSSSNVYNYAENQVMEQDNDFSEEVSQLDKSNDGPDDELDVEEHDNDDNEESEGAIDENENVSDQKDIHEQYTDDIDQIDDPSILVKGVDAGDDDGNDNEEEISPEDEHYVPEKYAEDNEPISDVDSGIHSENNGLKPHLIAGEVYYKNDEQINSRPGYQQEPLDYEDPDEIEQIFNDGEIHNDGDKYKDSNNNNYIDSDDSNAVAY